MFKHILIPTDGSPLSTRAALAGVQLAKDAARFHVLSCRRRAPGVQRVEKDVWTTAGEFAYLR